MQVGTVWEVLNLHSLRLLCREVAVRLGTSARREVPLRPFAVLHHIVTAHIWQQSLDLAMLAMNAGAVLKQPHPQMVQQVSEPSLPM